MQLSYLVLLALLLAAALGQQICVRKECPTQRQKCIEDPTCQKVIGDAIEKCTLQSQGCMLFNTNKNAAAVKFVSCSYAKCLNI